MKSSLKDSMSLRCYRRQLKHLQSRYSLQDLHMPTLILGISLSDGILRTQRNSKSSYSTMVCALRSMINSETSIVNSGRAYSCKIQRKSLKSRKNGEFMMKKPLPVDNSWDRTQKISQSREKYRRQMCMSCRRSLSTISRKCLETPISSQKTYSTLAEIWTWSEALIRNSNQELIESISWLSFLWRALEQIRIRINLIKWLV